MEWDIIYYDGSQRLKQLQTKVFNTENKRAADPFRTGTEKDGYNRGT
jgi:hypothetical protein